MKRCFEDPSWCNGSREHYNYKESSNAYCKVRDANAEEGYAIEPCVAVSMQYFNGLIKCTGRERTRVWEYFTALNYLKCKTINSLLTTHAL